MVVRDYQNSDRERCLSVFDSNVPRYFAPEEREQFASFLDSQPGTYLVVENGTELVGCGGYAAHADGTVALCWGMVQASFHGRGIGRLLLQKRLDRIRSDLTIRRVTMNTSQHTHTFFEEFGFVVHQILPDGYAPGLDRYEMSLVLSADVGKNRTQAL